MLRTVNVIEYSDGTILQLVAFPDNEEGNRLADIFFMIWLKKIIQRY